MGIVIHVVVGIVLAVAGLFFLRHCLPDIIKGEQEYERYRREQGDSQDGDSFDDIAVNPNYIDDFDE